MIRTFISLLIVDLCVIYVLNCTVSNTPADNAHCMEPREGEEVLSFCSVSHLIKRVHPQAHALVECGCDGRRTSISIASC